MKKKDIKRHLTNYSIYSKRKSTINNAFASALSIADEYDERKINKALNILGKSTENDLCCAYCGEYAQTWDHIKALVVDGQFSGYGHQINNLIPCCKSCNSSKGNLDWKVYLEKKQLNNNERIKKIENYINNGHVDFINILQTDDFKSDIKKFNDIKDQVLQLLKNADEQAKIIRNKLKEKLNA